MYEKQRSKEVECELRDRERTSERNKYENIGWNQNKGVSDVNDIQRKRKWHTYFDEGSCMIAQRRIEFGVENLLFMCVCWCV